MLHTPAGEKRICNRLYSGFLERRDRPEPSSSSRKETQNEAHQEIKMAKNGLNKVMLIGNLGRDPEQKFLQNGGSVCTFSLGTTESFTKDGEQKERTEWHNVVFFGKLAEIAGEYLSKGSNVYVEGSLKTEKWEDRDGNKKQVTKVIGSKLIMLGERKKKDGREPGDEEDAPF
jgi:single-strand DNA-binding protein